MAGLLWPIEGHPTTQRFAGAHKFEPELFLATDAIGARLARVKKFGDAVQLPHVHGAIDIGCDVRTKLFAPEAGRIVKADRYKSTGENFLMLQIRPGTILFFTHLFAPDLEKFRRKAGRHVKRGQVIALTGNSGMSTGPHLHWEVRISLKPGARVERSGRWFKWNPRRLQVGGDLAGLRAILPIGAQPEPELDPEEQLEVAPGPIDETPEPPGGPGDPLAGPAEDFSRAMSAGEFDADQDPEDDGPDDDDDEDFGDFATTLDRKGGPHGHM